MIHFDIFWFRFFFVYLGQVLPEPFEFQIPVVWVPAWKFFITKPACSLAFRTMLMLTEPFGTRSSNACSCPTRSWGPFIHPTSCIWPQVPRSLSAVTLCMWAVFCRIFCLEDLRDFWNVDIETDWFKAHPILGALQLQSI